MLPFVPVKGLMFKESCLSLAHLQIFNKFNYVNQNTETSVFP